MGAVTRRSPLATESQQGHARRHRPDYWLLLLSVSLLAIGVIVVYAISPALTVEKHVSGNFYVSRQLIAVFLSLLAFGVTAFVPLASWRQWYKPLLFLALAVTVFALVLPANPQYPAHRWIRLGSLSFQSVELLKFALLVWIAGLLGAAIVKGTITHFKETGKPLLIGVLVSGAVVAGVQSDFGSTIVMIAMIGAMVFVAGFPLKRIALIGVLVGLAGLLAISAVPYRRARITAFMHQGSVQSCASLTSGYQACQALIAVGSGGMVGLGLGRSVQAFGYLPEAENDSIFAIYAEKFGFIGGVLLLGIFFALFARIKRVMERAPDDFTRLLATGVFAWLAAQAMINIGAMVGLLPLKGITLPFISYGGTSVIFVMAAMGLVFQISRYTSYSVPRSSSSNGNGRTGYEDNRDRRRVRGAYHPDLSSRP